MTGYLVEKKRLYMEASSLIKVFCGNILVMGKAGSLVNKTQMEMVGEAGYRLGETSIYPKFLHL